MRCILTFVLLLCSVALASSAEKNTDKGIRNPEGTGADTEAISGSPRTAPDSLTQKHMVSLASSGPEELSYDMPEKEYGAFTYFLLQGLTGAADSDKDGLISATELSKYIHEQTSLWAAQEGRRQRSWRVEKATGEVVLVQPGGIIPRIEVAIDYDGDKKKARPARVEPIGPDLTGEWKWEGSLGIERGVLTVGGITIKQLGPTSVRIRFQGSELTEFRRVEFDARDGRFQDGEWRMGMQIDAGGRGATNLYFVDFRFKLSEDGNTLSGTGKARTKESGLRLGGGKAGHGEEEVVWTRVR